jgi:hypothetical protein
MMDKDASLTMVEVQDYRYALNIRNGYGSVLGVSSATKGNEKVTYPLPAGTNYCIGTAEDERGKSVLYFVWNDTGEHTILRYFPNKNTVNPAGEIELIAQGAVLNFNKDWKIDHAFLIDMKYLYWTDCYTEEGTIVGNPPRKINIEKANVTKRSLCYELHTEVAEDFLSSVPASGITFTLRDKTYSSFMILSAVELTPFVGDPNGFLEFVETKFNLHLSAWMESVVFCDCKLILCTKMRYGDTVELTLTSGDPIAGDMLLVPTDHYPISLGTGSLVYSLEEQHISLIKRPFQCAPRTTYTLDTLTKSNNVNNSMFQFRSRIWYDDGEKSSWSAISIYPVPLDLDGNFLGILNAILVDYTQDILALPSWRCILKKIEISFRVGLLGAFRTIDWLDICEIGITANVLTFFNDRLYQIVPSDDYAPDSSVQSLKHFDNVPRLTGCLEFVSNREGKGRIFAGANLENYDVNDCVDLSINLDPAYEDPCLVTVKGTVNIDTTGIPSQVVYESVFENNKGNINDGKLYVKGMVYDVGTGRWAAISNNNLDENLSGFVVYLAGTSHFGVSKNNIIVPELDRDGSFEIKNVPKGKYILRVASFDVMNSDENGTIHNLQNGIAWQKTSAPVNNCAGSLAATGNAAERIIDLTGVTSGVFDLDTEVGYGEILINHLVVVPDDRTFPFSGVTGRYAIEGYLLDNNAIAGSKDERQGAIACERQKLNFETLSDGASYPGGWSGAQTVITDHNGYFYWIYQMTTDAPTPSPNRFKNVYPVVPDTCGGGTRTLSSVMGTNNVFSGDLYTSGYAALFDSPTFTTEFLVSYDPNGEIHRSLTIAESWLLFNKDQTFTDNNKTIVQGTVLEATNIGVERTLICIERNGRQEETDPNGNYAISVYCPWDKDHRDDDDLFPQYLLDKCALYPPSPADHTLAITNYCSPYNSTTPYEVPDFTYGFSGALSIQEKYLKAGGTYRTGIVYEDIYNRKSTVVEGNTLRVPFHTERGFYGKTYTAWELNGIPPIWAHHYRLVRTKDSFYSRYLQLKVESIEYVIYTDVTASPVTTSYTNADYTHIHLKVSGLFDEDPDNEAAIWFFRGENDIAFSAEARDRVRFVLNQNDELVANDKILDFEIRGKYVDGNEDYWVIIDGIELFEEIFGGWLIELYTPKRSEEIIFYEVGECHNVLEPYTSNRRHSGPIQNQVVGVQPAKGLLLGGDTYWRKRLFTVDEGTVYNILIENANLSDSFDSLNEDIGRANIRDDDFGERFYPNKITYSDIFIPDTKYNGLSAFIGVSQQDVDVRFGIIKRLAYVGDVLLAICEFKIQPFYVGKDNVLSLVGTSDLGRSDRTMNAANELIQDFGTQHPSSIAHDGNYCYGFDARQGVAWRYATNGLTEISKYKVINEFNNIGKEFSALSPLGLDVLSIFDREFKCYYLTFPTIPGRPAATISFDETKNGWNSYYSYIPDYYGITGLVLVSFKDGELWVHESDNVPRANFYGVQYDAEIDMVFNFQKKATKLMFNIEIQSDKKFYAPLITIPANSDYPLGMRSSLLANRFKSYEGHWNADLLRDMNDNSAQFRAIVDPLAREVAALLRGRNLRGEVMTVKLRLADAGEDFSLKRVDIGFALSEETKK